MAFEQNASKRYRNFTTTTPDPYLLLFKGWEGAPDQVYNLVVRFCVKLRLLLHHNGLPVSSAAHWAQPTVFRVAKWRWIGVNRIAARAAKA
jgi:hypothetical protein